VALIDWVPPATNWSTMMTDNVMAAMIKPPAKTRRPISCSSPL
jgi:hypothetical protein